MRLILLAIIVAAQCPATAIVARSDGKQIAVAAASKGSLGPELQCKIKRVPGGVFFASGDVLFKRKRDIKSEWETVYNAYEVGARAALEGGNAKTMVMRFVEMSKSGRTSAVEDHIQRRDEEYNSEMHGQAASQAGFALFAEGKPSIAVITFYPVFDTRSLTRFT